MLTFLTWMRSCLLTSSTLSYSPVQYSLEENQSVCAPSLTHVRLCDPRTVAFKAQTQYMNTGVCCHFRVIIFCLRVEYLHKLFEILLNEKFFSFPLQHIWSFIPITIKSLTFIVYFQFQILLQFVQIVSALALGCSFNWLHQFLTYYYVFMRFFLLLLLLL